MTENLASALAAFQLELPTIAKDNMAKVEGKEGRQGYTYRYADLAEISSVVLPLLAKHGLSFASKPTIDESNRFVLEYALRHVSGEADTGRYLLPNAAPQQVGSAITYARRYVLCAITGVAPGGDDDDGKAATDNYQRDQYEPVRSWDPHDQASLFGDWQSEISQVWSLDQLTDVLRRVQRSKDLSPASKDKVVKLCVERRVELEQGGPVPA